MKDTNSFQAAEICAILDSCHKNNVKSFELGRLKIAFETSTAQVSAETSFVNQLEAEAAPLAKAHEPLPDFDALPPEEAVSLLEDLRMAQLMTNDPLAYEQEMIDANLNRQGVDDAIEVHRRSEQTL